MKKKVLITFIVLAVIAGINLFTLMTIDTCNKILKDRLFIFEGISYYATNDERDVIVSFIVVDSKNILNEKKCRNVSAKFDGLDQAVDCIKSVSMDLLNKYSSYSVHSITCTIDSKQLHKGINVFRSITVIDETGGDLLSLPIGKVIIEKVEQVNPTSEVVIGYNLNLDEKNRYPLNIDNKFNSNIKFNKVHFVLEEDGKEVEGSWEHKDSTVSKGAVDAELNYMFQANEQVLYLQPVVYYTKGNTQYSEIAKVATSYLDDIDKEDIIAYIEEVLD